MIHGKRSHDEPRDIGPVLDAVPREDGGTEGAGLSGHAGWDLARGTAGGAVCGHLARAAPWQPGTAGLQTSDSSLGRFLVTNTANDDAKMVTDGTLASTVVVRDLVSHARKHSPCAAAGDLDENEESATDDVAWSFARLSSIRAEAREQCFPQEYWRADWKCHVTTLDLDASSWLCHMGRIINHP